MAPMKMVAVTAAVMAAPITGCSSMLLRSSMVSGPGFRKISSATTIFPRSWIGPPMEMALTRPDHEVPARGNTEMLFRAVRNLADNALKHSAAGDAIEIVRPVQGG